MTVKVDPSNKTRALDNLQPLATPEVIALMKHEPMAPPELIAEAKEVIDDGLRNLALSYDVIGCRLIGLCRRVPTTAVPTLAVTIAGDGFAMLLYNPHYTVKLGEDAVFVLAHEAGHLLWRHLYVNPSLNENPTWRLASEASLNAWVMKMLKREELPAFPNDAGKPEEQGVNPRKVWEAYRKDLKENGKVFLPYEEFITPDLRTFAELERMSKPPKSQGKKLCLHHQHGAGVNLPGGGTDGAIPLDQEEVDNLVGEVLKIVMHDALDNNNRHAREQLLALSVQTEGSEKAAKVWGNLGLGMLRGEAVETGKIEFWKQWLSNGLAERLQPGQKLQLNKKIWWDPRVVFRGDEPYRRVLVATDASGSMHTAVLNYIRRLCGEEEGLEVVYASWDAEMWALVGGEAFRGGGGTDVQCVIDYVEGRTAVEGLPEVDGPDYFDAVVVITDGFMAHRMPADPDRWVWLITPGGNEWPGELGMDCWPLPEDCEAG